MPSTQLSSTKTRLPPVAVTKQSVSRASEDRPIAAKKSLSKLGQSIITTQTTSRLIKSMSRSLTDKRNSIVTSQPERKFKHLKEELKIVTQAKREETTGFGDFYHNVRKFESVQPTFLDGKCVF